MQEENKKKATEFLQMVIAGTIDEAYEKYVDMDGKHHNTFTPAGFRALADGMKGAEEQFPDKQFVIQHVIAEDDLVAIHSHLTLNPGEVDFTAVHLFRLTDGKIVEMWDIAQDITKAVNEDGAF